MLPARQLTLLCCLAALLLAALTPIVTGLLFAFLIPVLFFIAAVAEVPLRAVDEPCAAPQLVIFPTFSPRPPPVQ